MIVYGIFRGFPGLGRVMSGISLLLSMKEQGHIVKAYSYFRGAYALDSHKIDTLLDEQPSDYNVTSIGLNPVCIIAEKLISRICQDKPDLVLVDGEPLFISTLAMVFSKDKIVSLLNPADLYNEANPLSSINFFRYHYLAAGKAIVHGVDKENILLPDDNYGCKIIKTNTILRKSVIEIKTSSKKFIVAILGGGSNNASENFKNSTIEIGNRIIQAAAILQDEKFRVYCNDKYIADALYRLGLTNNIEIIYEYTSPEVIYSSAKTVLCRAGRNTISEIMFLGIPSILISSSGDFRSAEQEQNIKQACLICPSLFVKSTIQEDRFILVQKIKETLAKNWEKDFFVPGNKDALDFILK